MRHQRLAEAFYGPKTDGIFKLPNLPVQIEFFFFKHESCKLNDNIISLIIPIVNICVTYGVIAMHYASI